MKFLVLVAVLAVAVARPDDGFYDSKYDNFDVEELIGNMRLLKAYCHCFRSIGKCTPEGAEFKKWIPDSLHSDCGKCSEKQKTLIAKVMKAIMQKIPEEWDELLKHYNPNGESTDAIDAFLKKYSSN